MTNQESIERAFFKELGIDMDKKDLDFIAPEWVNSSDTYKLDANKNYNVGGCTNPSAKLEVKGTRVFDTGSQRDNDTNKPLPNHLDAYVRLRYGYLLRYGANHYDKGNWRKGQPTEAALESLHRHLAKFEMNLYNGVEQDEDHLSAIIFGIQLIMKNEEKEGISTDHYYKPI